MSLPYIKKYLPLLFILCLGVVVFFVRLSTIPNGLYIDETLPGYSAYSILLTKHDEYGKFFPLVFRFYGSYNPPLFIYSVVLSESLFGLTTFAVRAPSALFGLLSVIPIYLLIRQSEFKNKNVVSILTGLLFVITPWIVLHSRVGYEVSLGFFLLSSGIYFAYRSLQNIKCAPVGMLFLSASTYAAYAERFLVPLFLITFFIFFRKTIWRNENRKILVYTLMFGFITQIPNIILLTSPAFFPKQDLIGQGIVSGQSEKLARVMPMPLAYMVSFVREFLSQYITYFSPESLFFRPDPDLQRSIPFLSVFYTWCLIPFFGGVYWLYSNSKKRFARFVFLLLLICPIPAALTKDPFSTHRALPQLLPIILIISCGIELLITKFSKKIIIVYLVCFIFSLFTLWRSYFVLLPFLRASSWGYGLDQVAEFIKSNPNEQFVFDESRQHPVYSQLLFYMKFDPSSFQSTISPTIIKNYYQNPPFDSHFNFGNVSIRSVNWETDAYTQEIIIGDTIVVSESQAKEHLLTKVLEVKDPTGEVQFVGWRTDPLKKCKIEKVISERCAIINTGK